ncbi:MAG: hypothetical protein ACM3YN_05085 [Parcubacteria group bacterium]
MKKYLLATTVAAALCAAAPAFAQPTGYIGFSDSQAHVKAMGVKDDGNTVTVDGTFLFPIQENAFVKLDGNIDDVDGDTMGGVTAHVGTRFGGGLVAGFVGAANVDDEAAYSAGVEGQFYPADNATLAGTLGYSKIDDEDLNIWNASVEGRYFVSDNFRLNANLGYLRADVSGENGDGWDAGLGAEYQLANTPLSFFGGYNYVKSDDADLTANVWTLGFRMNFNGSLKDRDRSGAGLSGTSSVSNALLF